MANRNTFWAETLAAELARAGLKEVCLAPGSRSTPLVLAFAKHPDIEIYTHLDERSAGFFALGLAKASKRPVALVCTSGTAAANFFPAVVEAHQSGVPLLVLSADRPFELRDSGANQSIDQIKLFGNFALWSVDVALPEAQPEAVFVRSLRTLVARAYATAQGPRPGVVHLNLPFRKPLEPIPAPGDLTEAPAEAGERPGAFTEMLRPTPKLEAETVKVLSDALLGCRSGVIVCGVDCPRDEAFRKALGDFSKQSGFPIFADAASGIRFSGTPCLSGFDSYLASDVELPCPELVLRFGRAPTSAPLQRYLAGLEPKESWQVSAAGLWADETHSLTRFIHADEAHVCQGLSEALKAREYHSDSQMRETLERLESLTWNFWQEHLSDKYFDGSVTYNLMKDLPEDSLLFVGNSLSVRHLEQFGYSEKALEVYANRGASGIDGNVSTALGLGAARPNRPLFMLLGDLTLYHDMNGLWGLKHPETPVTIVLLNNNGGGIFRRLPIAEYKPEFSKYFLTPLELDFEHVAALYGLEYHPVTSLETFQKALATSEHPKLIDVQTDSAQDAETRNGLLEQYRNFVREHFKEEV